MFFFFKQKTAYEIKECDWSSDVCSSDLAGSLAATNAATTAYGDGDVLVELGALNTDAPDGLVTPTKFFIHRALIGITTAAGQTLVGGLSLSATSDRKSVV